MLYESNILLCCFWFPVIWFESFIKAKYAELQLRSFEHCSNKYLQCSVNLLHRTNSYNMYVVVFLHSAGSVGQKSLNCCTTCLPFAVYNSLHTQIAEPAKKVVKLYCIHLQKPPVSINILWTKVLCDTRISKNVVELCGVALSSATCNN